MAKNTQSTKSNIPKFTIDAPKTSTAVAKLTVPRVRIDDLGKTITDLLKQLSDSGVEGKVIKGTLTVY